MNRKNRSYLWSRITSLKQSRKLWRERFEHAKTEIQQLKNENNDLRGEIEKLLIEQSKRNGWLAFELRNEIVCNHKPKHARGMCRNCYDEWYQKQKIIKSIS